MKIKKSKIIGLRLSDELHNYIVSSAMIEGVSISEFIRKFIVFYKTKEEKTNE